MVKVENRVLYIDMDEIKIPRTLKASREAFKFRHRARRLDPFSFSDPFRKRAYDTVEQLQAAIDGYFKKCQGVKYYKGKPMVNIDGEPVIGQVEPYTISGLARHLGISQKTLKQYKRYAKMGLVPPEFGDIIDDACMRIQEYAEKRLYDRDGSSGARFVLEAGFGWMTEKEAMELRQSNKRIDLTREKLEFIKKQAEEEKLQDKELIVNILRADEDK